MRFAIVVAVLLAVVSTAVVGVCQHSESRRLQHRVWELERRRMRLEREAERLEFAIESARTPRRLLQEHDGLCVPAPVSDERAPDPLPTTPPATDSVPLPPGFVTGGNFEGEGR